jgi:hypothetical protein
MKLYVAGEKVGVSIEKNDVEDAFGKFGKLGPATVLRALKYNTSNAAPLPVVRRLGSLLV